MRLFVSSGLEYHRIAATTQNSTIIGTDFGSIICVDEIGIKTVGGGWLAGPPSHWVPKIRERQQATNAGEKGYYEVCKLAIQRDCRASKWPPFFGGGRGFRALRPGSQV